MGLAGGKVLAERGRENRQRILDYLNEHPLVSCRVISAAVGATPSQTGARLNLMRIHREVEAFDSAEGGHTCQIYRALVEKTKENYSNLPHAAHAVPSSPSIVVPPGARFIPHRCSDTDPPIQNQGGQGCVGAQPRTSSILDGLF